jgi:hypothetical protein
MRGGSLSQPYAGSHSCFLLVAVFNWPGIAAALRKERKPFVEEGSMKRLQKSLRFGTPVPFDQQEESLLMNSS